MSRKLPTNPPPGAVKPEPPPRKQLGAIRVEIKTGAFTSPPPPVNKPYPSLWAALRSPRPPAWHVRAVDNWRQTLAELPACVPDARREEIEALAREKGKTTSGTALGWLRYLVSGEALAEAAKDSPGNESEILLRAARLVSEGPAT